MTRREERARIKRLADADWRALSSENNPVRHARQHLAEMPAERRAMLEEEWPA